ncbi:hypothetical protein [Pyruvatibacter mobilis]|uniref:hypothetical protein n=1 Tax=Pyruvatibacter mobilis TaxID=1712261 RepID=UPI003BB16335
MFIVLLINALQRVNAEPQLDKRHHDRPERLQELFLLRLSQGRIIKEDLVFLDIDAHDGLGRSVEYVFDVSSGDIIGILVHYSTLI